MLQYFSIPIIAEVIDPPRCRIQAGDIAEVSVPTRQPGQASPLPSPPWPLQFPEFDALQCCSLAKPTAAGKNMEKSLKHRLLTLI